jgi:DNA-binding response OmpR family regulator
LARILIVDDEPIIAMTMADWLTDLGHSVIGPATEYASDVSLAQQALDDAILDISLGSHTTATIARGLGERRAPFAVASGYEAQSMDAAFARGLILAKPFGFETFRRLVERLLDGGS